MQATTHEAEAPPAASGAASPGPAPAPTDWIRVLQGVQAALTSAAIVIGGLWAYWEFIVTREDFSKADSEHELHVMPLNQEHWLVRVAVTMTNRGTRVIRPDYGEVRIQQILPLANCPVPCPRIRIEAGEDPVLEGERGIRWPLLRRRAGIIEEGELKIEPGESDTIDADFVIASGVEANSFFSVRGAEDLGWRRSTIHILKPETSPP